MIKYPAPKYPQRKHRKIHPPRRTAPPTPAALVLVAATYDKDNPSADLAFDRPIDVSAMDVSTVIVDDDAYLGARLIGFGSPTLVNPTTVRVMLEELDGAQQPEVHLTVGPDNGIVADDDEGTWAGVADLQLPFG